MRIDNIAEEPKATVKKKKPVSKTKSSSKKVSSKSSKVTTKPKAKTSKVKTSTTPKSTNTVKDERKQLVESLSTNSTYDDNIMLALSSYDVFWMLYNAPLHANFAIVRAEKYYEGCAIDDVLTFTKVSPSYYHEIVHNKYNLNIIDVVNEIINFDHLNDYGIVLTTEDLDTIEAYNPKSFSVFNDPINAEKEIAAKDFVAIAISNIVTAINLVTGENYEFEYRTIDNGRKGMSDRTLYIVSSNDVVIASSENIYNVLIDISNQLNKIM